MLVVSDTSPITNLAAVGHLDLLRVLYTQITIPEEVRDELVLGGTGNNPGAREVLSESWFVVASDERRRSQSAVISSEPPLGEPDHSLTHTRSPVFLGCTWIARKDMQMQVRDMVSVKEDIDMICPSTILQRASYRAGSSPHAARSGGLPALTNRYNARRQQRRPVGWQPDF
ncbi:MAG: hypothetical protein ACLQUY_07155 [Ktedonobacterales bacterium]